jgi:hypothetical protein
VSRPQQIRSLEGRIPASLPRVGGPTVEQIRPELRCGFDGSRPELPRPVWQRLGLPHLFQVREQRCREHLRSGIEARIQQKAPGIPPGI